MSDFYVPHFNIILIAKLNNVSLSTGTTCNVDMTDMGYQSMTTRKNLYLSDNRIIPEEQLHTIKAFIKEMGRIIDNREALVEKYDLDRLFAFPDGPGWNSDRPCLSTLWNNLSNILINDLNKLRMYTAGISIWDLKKMQRAVGDLDLNPVREGFDDELAERLSVFHDFVYQWASDTCCIPDCYIVKTPFVMGEVGHLIKGVLVNPDIQDCQERINLLYFSGIIDYLLEISQRVGQVNILEIGAGYGALALALKRMIPLSSYVICDLPEVLSYSYSYISGASPDLDHHLMTPESLHKDFSTFYGFYFLPNIYFDFLKATDITFDIVINTLSLSEMSDYQARYYAEGISKLIGDKGILFEQNQDNSLIRKTHQDMEFKIDGIDIKNIFPNYFKTHYDIEKELHIPHPIRHGHPFIWGNRDLLFLKAWQPEVSLMPTDESDGFSCHNSLNLFEFVELYKGFNIIRCCDRYYASSGSLHILKGFVYFDQSLLEKVKSENPNVVYFEKTLEDIKQAISSDWPLK